MKNIEISSNFFDATFGSNDSNNSSVPNSFSAVSVDHDLLPVYPFH